MRGNAFKKTNKHPTIPSSGHGYKSRTFEEFCHTYNALEQLWSRRQFSRGEANSPRTNRLSFACFPREWVARCSIFVSWADLRSRLWPFKLTTQKPKWKTFHLNLLRLRASKRPHFFITQLSIRWIIHRCTICYYCHKYLYKTDLLSKFCLDFSRGEITSRNELFNWNGAFSSGENI